MPDEASLRDAALSYLARFSATEASVRRVLKRRIARWQRVAEADGLDREQAAETAAHARAVVDGIVARLSAGGAIDDAAFAEARARRLSRAGKSRRAVVAHLAAKGVADAEVIAQAVAGDEIASALILARRRKVGPFRQTVEADKAHELALFARAGFTSVAARRAIGMTREEAEAVIAEQQER